MSTESNATGPAAPKGFLVVALLALAVFVYAAGAFWPRVEPLLLGLSTIQVGVLASLVAGLFTAVGAIPIFFLRRITRVMEDALMGFGAGAVSMMTALLPWGLAFAGGAMLFVISHEIIPESHRKGHEAQATLGVLIGFVALLAIDVALG